MGKKKTKEIVYVGMAQPLKRAARPRTATFDVSKPTLDIRVLQGKDERLQAPMQVSNDEKGAAACVKHLAHFEVKLIVFEATGGLENLIAMKLHGP